MKTVIYVSGGELEQAEARELGFDVVCQHPNEVGVRSPDQKLVMDFDHVLYGNHEFAARTANGSGRWPTVVRQWQAAAHKRHLAAIPDHRQRTQSRGLPAWSCPPGQNASFAFRDRRREEQIGDSRQSLVSFHRKIFAPDMLKIHRRQGRFHVQPFQVFHDNSCDRKISEPLMVRRNYEPGCLLGAATRQASS